MMEADGSNMLRLTYFGLERATTPRWSPDGARIAFTAGAVRGDIYLVNAAGGTPRILVGGPAYDSLPSWSADGELVYFTSNRGGSSEIWAIPHQQH